MCYLDLEVRRMCYLNLEVRRMCYSRPVRLSKFLSYLLRQIECCVVSAGIQHGPRWELLCRPAAQCQQHAQSAWPQETARLHGTGQWRWWHEDIGCTDCWIWRRRESLALSTVIIMYLHAHSHHVNPLIATLKPQSNGPPYSNTVIGTLAVDGGLLHLVQRGGDWAGLQPAQAPPRCTKCNSPPINGQCTNFLLFDIPL